MQDEYGRELHRCVGGPLDGQSILATEPPPSMPDYTIAAGTPPIVHYKRQQLADGEVVVVPSRVTY